MTPWALRLATPRLPATPAAYATITLDPATQAAVYRGHDGHVITMGSHGTNTTHDTTSYSGGAPDGGKPAPQVSDDTSTDYSPDQSGDN